jgi:DNA-binding GntR family transcriptional regulator
VAIAKAIASGDADAATEAMRTHLRTAIGRIDDAFAAVKIPS